MKLQQIGGTYRNTYIDNDYIRMTSKLTSACRIFPESKFVDDFFMDQSGGKLIIKKRSKITSVSELISCLEYIREKYGDECVILNSDSEDISVIEILVQDFITEAKLGEGTNTVHENRILALKFMGG